MAANLIPYLTFLSNVRCNLVPHNGFNNYYFRPYNDGHLKGYTLHCCPPRTVFFQSYCRCLPPWKDYKLKSKTHVKAVKQKPNYKLQKFKHVPSTLVLRNNNILHNKRVKSSKQMLPTIPTEVNRKQLISLHNGAKTKLELNKKLIGRKVKPSPKFRFFKRKKQIKKAKNRNIQMRNPFLPLNSIDLSVNLQTHALNTVQNNIEDRLIGSGQNNIFNKSPHRTVPYGIISVPLRNDRQINAMFNDNKLSKNAFDAIEIKSHRAIEDGNPDHHASVDQIVSQDGNSNHHVPIDQIMSQDRNHNHHAAFDQIMSQDGNAIRHATVEQIISHGGNPDHHASLDQIISRHLPTSTIKHVHNSDPIKSVHDFNAELNVGQTNDHLQNNQDRNIPENILPTSGQLNVLLEASPQIPSQTSNINNFVSNTPLPRDSPFQNFRHVHREKSDTLTSDLTTGDTASSPGPELHNTPGGVGDVHIDNFDPSFTDVRNGGNHITDVNENSVINQLHISKDLTNIGDAVQLAQNSPIFMSDTSPSNLLGVDQLGGHVILDKATVIDSGVSTAGDLNSNVNNQMSIPNDSSSLLQNNIAGSNVIFSGFDIHEGKLFNQDKNPIASNIVHGISSGNFEITHLGTLDTGSIIKQGLTDNFIVDNTFNTFPSFPSDIPSNKYLGINGDADIIKNGKVVAKLSEFVNTQRKRNDKGIPSEGIKEKTILLSHTSRIPDAKLFHNSFPEFIPSQPKLPIKLQKLHLDISKKNIKIVQPKIAHVKISAPDVKIATPITNLPTPNGNMATSNGKMAIPNGNIAKSNLKIATTNVTMITRQIPASNSLSFMETNSKTLMFKETLPLDICHGCRMDGGVGYTNHPTSCDRFVVCYPTDAGELRPMTQLCPYGLFWSQSALTCRLTKDVFCPHEICKYQLDKYQYASKRTCRSYWECQGGQSVARCCPYGYSFLDGRGCVEDLTCEIPDIACIVDNKNTIEWGGPCDKRPVSRKNNFYQRKEKSKWLTEQCPVGWIYKTELCECTKISELSPPEYFFEGHTCVPEIYLPFTTDFSDHSGNNVYVRVDNASLTSGAACFHGNSAIAIPAFANMDYGSTFYMHVRYKQKDPSANLQTLVFNGDCEKTPTMILGTKPTGNSLSFITNLNEEKKLWVESKASLTNWRDVWVKLENGKIILQSKDYITTSEITGSIARSECGMKIGWGRGYDNFVGCIDEVSIHRCHPHTMV